MDKNTAKLEKLLRETPSITPVLMVSNVDKMSSFYHKAFNLIPAFNMPNLSGRNVSAFLLFNNSRIILREEGQFDLKETAPIKTGMNPSISLLLQYKNVDEQYEAAKAIGVETIFAPKDMTWGGRLCKLRDPEGYIWFLEGFLGNEFSLDKHPIVQSR